MFGFASTLLASWETLAVYVPSPRSPRKVNVSSTLGVSLSNGGTAGMFWSYLIVCVGLGFVYASLAELGSM